LQLAETITQTILEFYPEVQAVYLFGSFGTGNEWPDSDADIALLLPPKMAKEIGPFLGGDLRFKLETLLQKDVDLINLRQAPTVFQKEIIFSERRIYCADTRAAEEFEMLVLSYYLKLNEERAEILSEGLLSGKFYDI